MAGEADPGRAAGLDEGGEDLSARFQVAAVDREQRARRVEAEEVVGRGHGLADGEERAGIIAEAAVEGVEVDVADRDRRIERDRGLLVRGDVGLVGHDRRVVDRVDGDGGGDDRAAEAGIAVAERRLDVEAAAAEIVRRRDRTSARHCASAKVMKSPSLTMVAPSNRYRVPLVMPVILKWVTSAPSTALRLITRPPLDIVSSSVVALVTLGVSATGASVSVDRSTSVLAPPVPVLPRSLVVIASVTLP